MFCFVLYFLGFVETNIVSEYSDILILEPIAQLC